MVTASTTSWLRRSFLIEEDGKLVGEIDGAGWIERAAATVGKSTYAFYRETLFKANYVMERDGQIVARAKNLSLFAPRFDVTWEDHTLLLRKLSLWTQTFGLFESDLQIGTVRPVGIFRRSATLEGASSVPLDIRVFLVWVVFMTWKRQS
ncbi:MAG TPA: hypothetical protein VE110_06345 [Gemmatimonadaceae bacterium]|nr:hypothetical protein [Gemmatimonadaceae bacterium]